MEIKTIFKEENSNTGTIVLRNEGLFWRAYEVSAYLFVKLVKKYTPIKKLYKIINSEVVYIGFPKNSIEQIKIIIKNLETGFITEEKEQLIISFQSADISGYNEWKNNISIKEAKTQPTVGINSIIDKIRSYPVIIKTPLEAQAFIIELQKEIDGTL